MTDDQSLNGDEMLLGRGHAFLVRRLGTAAARFARRPFFGNFVIVIGDADGGGQNGSIEAALFRHGCFITGFVTVTTIIVAVAVIPVVAIAAVVAVVALLTLRTAIVLILISSFDDDFGFFVFVGTIAGFIAPVIAILTLVTAPFALRAAFFLAAPIVGEHAEIMVGKLQIIFGVHPVAIMLGVLRQFFVFFQHLARIAAGAVVNPILVIVTVAIVILRTIVIAPAATAVGLAIIHKD